MCTEYKDAEGNDMTNENSCKVYDTNQDLVIGVKDGDSKITVYVNYLDIEPSIESD